MNIEVKSTAALLDELLTVLIKCWSFQEVVMKSQDEKEIARAAKGAQSTNAHRNALVRAIDQRLGEGEVTALLKTYTPDEIRRRFEENAE